MTLLPCINSLHDCTINVDFCVLRGQSHWQHISFKETEPLICHMFLHIFHLFQFTTEPIPLPDRFVHISLGDLHQPIWSPLSVSTNDFFVDSFWTHNNTDKANSFLIIVWILCRKLQCVIVWENGPAYIICQSIPWVLRLDPPIGSYVPLLANRLAASGVAHWLVPENSHHHQQYAPKTINSSHETKNDNSRQDQVRWWQHRFPCISINCHCTHIPHTMN